MDRKAYWKMAGAKDDIVATRLAVHSSEQCDGDYGDEK